MLRETSLARRKEKSTPLCINIYALGDQSDAASHETLLHDGATNNRRAGRR